MTKLAQRAREHGRHDGKPQLELRLGGGLVRGYKEVGTITTPFDMTVLNDLDRFHLVTDTMDPVPQTGDKGIYLKQQLKDKLVEHKQCIDKYGEDMPRSRHWLKKGEWNHEDKTSFPGTAPQDGCLLARRQLSVGGPDLFVR